ncbi:MAG: hypothetical protein Q4B72_15510 [Lachnospiraceae bacterium]|nr:hypothetical protein [Lachnospiraceae bacterium]
MGTERKYHQKTDALRWLSEVIGKRKGYILGLLVLQVILGASSILYAIFLRGLIDSAVSKEA